MNVPRSFVYPIVGIAAGQGLLELCTVKQHREHGQPTAQGSYKNLMAVALLTAGAALLLIMLTNFDGIP